MTASNDAMFAPPEITPKRRRKARPVDLVHLSRQTGGDRMLEEEVLRLFLRQAQAIAHAMRQRSDADSRKRQAHTLKGAARAIGAQAVARRAEKLEQAPDERHCLRALLREIDETCDFINAILR